MDLLEPSTVSTRDCAERAKKSPALRNLNFSEESRQLGPKIDSDFALACIDFIHTICLQFSIFYYPINIFYIAP